MKVLSVILYSFLLLHLACKPAEESDPRPPVSMVPEIDIKSIDPIELQQFETVIFKIGYLDGDGNIGDEDADVHALEILDNRQNILHSFHVPPQSPIENIAIEGVLVVEVENVILLDQSNTSESLTFNIRLKDRAGNWSNTVTSQTLTVTK